MNRRGGIPPVEHRFKKGESGNKRGYSKKRRQIDDLIALIDERDLTRAISVRWLRMILSGNYQFFKEFMERHDGPAVGTADPDNPLARQMMALLLRNDEPKSRPRPKAKPKAKRPGKPGRGPRR